MFRFLIYSLTHLFLLIPAAHGQKEIKKLNRQWKKAFHKNQIENNLEDCYWEEALLHFSKGEKYRQGETKAQLKALKNQISKIRKFKSLAVLKGEHGNMLQLGEMRSKEGRVYLYISAFRQMDSGHKIEVQLIKEKSNSIPASLDPIKHMRTLWEEYSNTHQPTKLLKQTYHEDAVYFNQGKIYNGIDEINPKYKYMASPNWKIKLYPARAEALDEERVFEIGKYKSNGEGMYVLVWNKRSDVWKIDFDFNF